MSNSTESYAKTESLTGQAANHFFAPQSLCPAPCSKYQITYTSVDTLPGANAAGLPL